MQKDSYLILGVGPDADEKTIRAAYEKLRKQYTDKLFSEGEEGMEASKKLSEIDLALADCLENLVKTEATKDYGTEFGLVEKYIKDGDIEKAQNALDDMESRNAEWHYFQAMIYYKKSWHLDCKKQLQIAISMDSTNEKYKKSLDKLEAIINGSQQQENAQRGGYQQQQYTVQDNSGACCNTCATLCCMDTCCECMGGDLCSCC